MPARYFCTVRVSAQLLYEPVCPPLTHTISPLCLVVRCLLTLDSNSKNAGQSSTGQENLVVVEDREVRWLLLKGEGADAANGAEEESTAGVAGFDLQGSE